MSATGRVRPLMHLRTLPTMYGALAVLAAPALASAQMPAAERVQTLADSLARAEIALGEIPGMSIAVARNGEILVERGYGKADLELDVAASPETVYGITSISKQITAAIVLRLAEQERLSLDDPITKYLPDYPVQGRAVTIRHLLNHTSGTDPMNGSAIGLPDPQWTRGDRSYREMVEVYGRMPFQFEPGERFGYNNLGYYLLGEIIGRVTGTSYAEEVERQLEPLGLESIVYCDDRRIVPNRAEAYEVDSGTLVHAAPLSMHVLGAAGALCSTAGDLVRWSHLLHGGTFVTPGSLRRMTSPTVLGSGDTVSYGFGLQLDRLEAHRKLWHGGTWPWGGYLAHYPEAGLTIAVLTNGARAGRVKAAEIEEALARAALGLASPQVRAAVSGEATRAEPRIEDLPLTVAEMARYEGAYALQMGGRTLELRVFIEDGELKASPAGQPPTRLLYQGDHTFVPAASPRMRFSFALDHVRATALSMRDPGGRTITGLRREP